jgi:threonine/homoserine/homoserine lactone efflux protein
MLVQVLAFTLAAILLTITPGLDTALVLRTSISVGAKRAFMAGVGIAAGCFVWGLLAAAGLAALLQASSLAYDILRWVGAAYLLYLGAKLIRSPRREVELGASSATSTGSSRWFVQGLLTNILNPKVGLFYVSFLPQFIPANVNVPAMAILLTAIHALLGVAWFGLLIAATNPVSALLRRGAVIVWLDRLTGGVFIAFGAKLALGGR